MALRRKPSLSRNARRGISMCILSGTSAPITSISLTAIVFVPPSPNSDWPSLCNLCVLCVSVVYFSPVPLTTETQRTQRLHREGSSFISNYVCPLTLRGKPGDDVSYFLR